MERKRLKANIIGLSEIYGHREFAQAKPLQPGRDYIPVSGAVRTGKEIMNGVEAALDGWWTEGKWVAEFEKGLRSHFSKQAVMVNSGSSANLIALAALKEVRDLPEGGEIITTALAFPTTVNPILQLGFKPHFIDVQLGSYVPAMNDIELAINEKTVAIMMAHTLGNPWPVTSFANEFPTIEDNCDAFGSDLQGMAFTGTIGDFSTLSFYPAHHITAGEGGAVICGKKRYEKVVRSFRDWGRDCWCPTGHEGTCGKRFDWKFDGLPDGYDHKYVYSRIGWNMKPTEMQAAIGVAQLEQLNKFVAVRRSNFAYLKQRFMDKELFNYFILPEEVSYGHASWFGFPLTLKMRDFTLTELIHKLEYQYKIGTRRIFAGNILAHPAYANIDHEATDLTNTVIASENSFWIGVWPRITPVVMDYMVESIAEAVDSLGGRV